MSTLVLDANAAVHAKQIGRGVLGGTTPLAALESLMGVGMQVAVTSRVMVEQNKMSLRETHEHWGARGWLRTERVKPQECNQVANALGPKMKRPNDPDIALIALARRIGGVLQTHDDAAAELAQRYGVVTIDVVDLAAFAVQRGLTTWMEIETGHVNLDTFAWRPDDWCGCVEATSLGRTRRDVLMSRLLEWLPVAPAAALPTSVPAAVAAIE